MIVISLVKMIFVKRAVLVLVQKFHKLETKVNVNLEETKWKTLKSWKIQKKFPDVFKYKFPIVVIGQN